jgi:hypothetical protein
MSNNGCNKLLRYTSMTDARLVAVAIVVEDLRQVPPSFNALSFDALNQT